MPVSIVVPDHIENEVAYRAAAEARIKHNAYKGRLKRWLAIEGNGRLHDFLFDQGEFLPKFDEETWKQDWHPATRIKWNNKFLMDMYQNLVTYGQLSERQTAAAITAMERCFEIVAKIEYERANSTSKHIGVVGQKAEFVATIKFIRTVDSRFGMSFMHNIVDEHGNKVTLFSTKELGLVGNSYRITATIKQHSEYQGVAQTVICRPKYYDCAKKPKKTKEKV